MTVISVHSVFGGVGKTLTTISCAVQLARLGFQTAVLELLHDGAVLYSWLYPLIPANYQPLTKETFASNRVKMANLQVTDKKLAQNLHLALASPAPEDIGSFNDRYVMSKSGQSTFQEHALAVLDSLHEYGAEIVFIDNPTGVSFLAGVNMSFQLNQCVRVITDDYRIWFMCRNTPIEGSKTLYEMAINQDYSKLPRPTMILNPTFPRQTLGDKRTLSAVACQYPLWKDQDERLNEVLETMELVTLNWDERLQQEDVSAEIDRIIKRTGFHGEVFTKLVEPLL